MDLSAYSLTAQNLAAVSIVWLINQHEQRNGHLWRNVCEAYSWREALKANLYTRFCWICHNSSGDVPSSFSKMLSVTFYILQWSRDSFISRYKSIVANPFSTVSLTLRRSSHKFCCIQTS